MTLVLDVTSNFAAGDQIFISGLSFKNFLSASAGNLELEVRNNGITAATDDKTKKIKKNEITSAANQTFTIGDPATLISTITITDDQATPTIKAKKDIRIRIPSTFNMTWATGITTIIIGGNAASKMNTKSKYEDGRKTLVLSVKTSFAAADYITVSGPMFANFTAVSTADNLELEVDNAGIVAAEDDKTIEIVTTPTAVNLISFTATGQDASIRVM